MATPSRQLAPLPMPASAIEMGGRSYFGTIWRLTRMELYKLRRRRYTTICLSMLLALLVLTIIVFSLYVFSQAQAPLDSYASPVCGQDAKGNFSCITPSYTQAQLQQLKNTTEQGFAQILGLPGSLTRIFQILGSVAVLALLVLSPIAGTEYTQGTIRLLFTRGPTRLQCMWGKVLASLLTCAGLVLLFSAVYVVLGMALYPLTGQPYSYAFSLLTAANIGTVLSNTLLIGLITISYWFAYAMLAFFFGTLGRATAAAIGAALGWYVLEVIANTVFSLLQYFIDSGPLHDLFTAIPTFLPGNNFGALIANRLHAISPSASAADISDQHALLVIGVYLLLLIGGAFLLARRRDVTH